MPVTPTASFILIEQRLKNGDMFKMKYFFCTVDEAEANFLIDFTEANK